MNLTYKEIGLARMLERKKKRYNKYINSIRESIMSGIPRGIRYGNSWPDSNSPTGYFQKCSYEVYGTCQSPCNGDC